MHRASSPVSRVLGIGLVALLALTLGSSDVMAKKKRGKKRKGASAAATAPVDDTNSPEDFGTGYKSWSTVGGATLGGDYMAVRAMLGARGSVYNAAIFQPKAHFILNMGENFDLGFGGAFGFFGNAFGAGVLLEPGVLVRYRFLGDGEQLQLAFEAEGGPVLWGMNGTAIVGFHVSPGVAGSFFIKDNMEIFFGGFLPFWLGALTGFGTVNWTFAVDVRGGFVYTLKKLNLGVFAQVDFLVGGASASVGFRTAGFVYINGYGQAGVQWRF